MESPTKYSNTQHRSLVRTNGRTGHYIDIPNAVYPPTNRGGCLRCFHATDEVNCPFDSATFCTRDQPELVVCHKLAGVVRVCFAVVLYVGQSCSLYVAQVHLVCIHDYPAVYMRGGYLVADILLALIAA